MLVTPAALPYETMSIDDVVWLSLDADDTAVAALAGRRPSSEWRLHRDLYRSRDEAGAVVHVHSPAATALARVESGPAAGRIVAVRQGPLLATSFHPEVTGDTRVHRLFVEIVRDAR